MGYAKVSAVCGAMKGFLLDGYVVQFSLKFETCLALPLVLLSFEALSTQAVMTGNGTLGIKEARDTVASFLASLLGMHCVPGYQGDKMSLNNYGSAIEIESSPSSKLSNADLFNHTFPLTVTRENIVYGHWCKPGHDAPTFLVT